MEAKNHQESVATGILETLTDDELVALSLKDLRIFAVLYNRHFLAVYRFITIRVGCASLAEDITSQTFLDGLQGLEGYSPQSKFLPWLFGTARHKIADYYRDQKRHEKLISLSQDSRFNVDTAEEFEAKWRLERVSSALRAISEDRAEALSLMLFGGLSTDEISVVMGRKPSAVKMLVSRAISDLRARFESGEKSDE